MHFAGVVDIGNAAARGIAAPGMQQVFKLRVVFRQVLVHPLQQQHGVGVVVATDKIAGHAILDVVPGLLEQHQHGVAAHLLMGVQLPAALAAPAVVEVREVELLHIVFTHQLKQSRQLHVVVHG